MTTIYTNNFAFPQEYIGLMLGKQQIREQESTPNY